jgi:hypothetical protein
MNMENILKKYRKPPSRFLQKDEGKMLDETTRSSMESLLGHDLRDVRIHQTGQAGEIARRLGAEAFAIGPDVFSDEGVLTGPFKQSTGLLAHELTHVVQQTRPMPVVGKSSTIMAAENPVSAHPARPQMSSPVSTQQEATSSPESRSEREASRAEHRARNRTRANRNSRPEIDPEQIADLVYRLMQTEIRIENDRMRR